MIVWLLTIWVADLTLWLKYLVYRFWEICNYMKGTHKPYNFVFYCIPSYMWTNINKAGGYGGWDQWLLRTGMAVLWTSGSESWQFQQHSVSQRKHMWSLLSQQLRDNHPEEGRTWRNSGTISPDTQSMFI